MMKYPIYLSTTFATLLAVCGPGLAQETGTVSAGAVESVPSLGIAEDVVARYPKGSIQNVAQADQALAEVKQRRAELNAQFLIEEDACYSKFFVTACTDAVKERRRLAFAQLNPIEVEANAFKRRDRVVERDKALAEQQAKDEARAAKRVETPKSASGNQVSPMPSKEEVMKMEEKASAASKDNNEPFLKTNEVREAQHKDKVEKMQAEEAAGAAQRTENVKDYERKQQKAQERQRKVEERKAKREAERARKIKEAP